MGVPLARATSRSPLPLVPLVIAAPVVYSVVRDSGHSTFPVTLTVVIGAACAAFAVDDRAEVTLSACPVSRASRRLARFGFVLAAVAAGWAAAAIALAISDRAAGPLGNRAAETVAIAAIAYAVAARSAVAGTDTAGVTGAVFALLAVGVSTGLGAFLRWLPQLENPTHRTRWAVVAGVALAAAGWWSRDPASATASGRLRGAFRH